MILVDLIEVSGALLVVNLRLYSFAACLDVDIADEYLLFVEARNRQNCRRSLKEGLCVELNHCIAGAWFRSTNKYRCHWRLNFHSLRLILLRIMNARCGRLIIRA